MTKTVKKEKFECDTVFDKQIMKDMLLRIKDVMSILMLMFTTLIGVCVEKVEDKERLLLSTENSAETYTRLDCFQVMRTVCALSIALLIFNTILMAVSIYHEEMKTLTYHIIHHVGNIVGYGTIIFVALTGNICKESWRVCNTYQEAVVMLGVFMIAVYLISFFFNLKRYKISQKKYKELLGISK